MIRIAALMLLTALPAWPVLAADATPTDPAAQEAAEKSFKPVIIWWGSSSSGMLKNYMSRVVEGRLDPVFKKGGMWFRADWMSKDIETGNAAKYEAMIEREKGIVAKRGKIDFGVLQLSGGILWDSPKTEKNVPRILDDMCKMIKGAGGQPVIFEHWTSRRPGPEKMRTYAIEAARRNGGRVAFCGSALAEVAEEKGGDKQGARYVGGLEGHTGSRGLYLATCCIYAALTGKSPVGLPLPAPKAGKVAIPKPEPDQAGGEAPAGTKEEGAGESHDDAITQEDAAYLQKKAWDVQQKYGKLIEAPEKGEGAQEARP